MAAVLEHKDETENPLLPDDDQDEFDGDLIEQEDGSYLAMPKPSPQEEHPDHYANLAEDLEASELSAIARELMQCIEEDKKTRTERDKQYAEGLKRSGLSGDAPGGADFDGASKAVHPAIAEACVDYSAAFLRELLPPEGPAKPHLEGLSDEGKRKIADRQSKCINWQITKDVSEFISELEQISSQVPMGGSQFIKFWIDAGKKRWTCEFVPVDVIHLPYACSDFYSSHRLTHEMRLTQATIDERVESGLYTEAKPFSPSLAPEGTEAQQASEKIEGVTPPALNEDGLQTWYETRWLTSFDFDKISGGEKRSYLVTIDEQTETIRAIYRNWDPEDPDQEPLQWMVEWGFIPWRGPYKLGLPHLIGTLAIASTGALRALLDSAHVNNAASAIALKGSGLGGQNLEIGVGEINELKAPVGMEGADIRKVVMPLPFNPPSAVLYQLLGWLDEHMKGVVTTAEEKLADATSQMPVGTTLALIEQGQKVMASIHARNWRSMQKCFEIIGRLNGEGGLSVERQKYKLSEVLAHPEDFRGGLYVQPVSDPRIFTEGQRFAQYQMGAALLTNNPLANQYELAKWGLDTANIPRDIIARVLPEPKGPKELNAVAENVAVMMGSPIIAFPEQDHMAHLEVHMRFVMDPTLGSNPVAMPRVFKGMSEHMLQHIAFYYAQVCHDIASSATKDIGEMLKNKQMQNQVDQLLAAASKLVHAGIPKQIGPIMPVLQKMFQVVQSMQLPPPMDPSQVAAQSQRPRRPTARRRRISRTHSSKRRKTRRMQH
jgi:hypothetical protein